MTPLLDSAVDNRTLLVRAMQDDPCAVEQLILRHATVVWAAVRAFRLCDADAKDVVQNTWLRMIEHLGAIREPERLSAWLVTTARRECLKVIRHNRRETFDAESILTGRPDECSPTPERHTIGRSMNRLLWQHIADTPGSGRDIVVELSRSDAPGYAEYAQTRRVPIGSIGPMRMRYLRKLRQRLESCGLGAEAWR